MPLIEGLNYVESNITNELLEIQTATDTNNATVVFGTGRKGKTNTLTQIRYTDVDTKFGEPAAAVDFDTDLSHAALAIQAATASRDKVMFGYKVGDSAKAKLELHESQVFLEGDNSFSLDSEGDPIIAMTFESLEEKEEANNNSVIIRKDDSGLPTSLVITLSTGYRKVFAVDPYGVRPGISSNVAELVNEINADDAIINELSVTVNALRKTNLLLDVQAGTIPFIEVESLNELTQLPGSNISWGDKLLNIEEIKELLVWSEEISPGRTSNRLKYAPIKDADANTVTISSFTRRIESDNFFTAVASNQTGTIASESLSIVSPSLGWDNSDLSVTNMVIKYYSGDNALLGEIGLVGSYTNPLEGYTYANGIIDILVPAEVRATGFITGDKIAASYGFGAILVEANTRSELQLGNENSYFVAGKDIVFGAAPTLPITPTYDAIKIFQSSDLNIADANSIKIEFINPNNAPEAGVGEIYMTFTYLPELPAPTAALITGNNGTVVQGSALKGGTAGSIISKVRYQELIKEALDVTLLVPFRRVIIAGSWLDDNVLDINPETGLEDTINLNWASMIATHLDLKSRVSGECHTVMGVKPITTTLLAQGDVGINTYYDYLINDVTDATSPAGLMDALDDYHVDVAVGSVMVSDSKILGGTQYLENPAYIICGMQLDGNLEESLIRRQVPPFVKSVLVKFPSGYIVGQMNNKRYTTIVVNNKQQFKVADAPTGADLRKTLSRQIVRDTTFTTVRIARDLAETFLGLKRTADKIALMKDRINRDVAKAMIPKYLTQFQAEIIPVAGGHITGQTKMRLILETSVEIRTVVFETTAKLGGEDIG